MKFGVIGQDRIPAALQEGHTLTNIPDFICLPGHVRDGKPTNRVQLYLKFSFLARGWEELSQPLKNTVSSQPPSYVQGKYRCNAGIFLNGLLGPFVPIPG